MGHEGPAKGVTMPGTRNIGQNDRRTHKELSYEDSKHAQAAAGLAQCTAMEFAVNTALQSMAEPGIGQSHQQHRRLV